MEIKCVVPHLRVKVPRYVGFGEIYELYWDGTDRENRGNEQHLCMQFSSMRSSNFKFAFNQSSLDNDYDDDM